MWLLAGLLLFFQASDYNAEGRKALEAKNYQAAVQFFTQAVQAAPKDYGAHFNLALSYSLELFGGLIHTGLWFGLAWGAFPVLTGGKGKATDTLGGIHGFLVTKSAPPEAIDFLKFFSQEKYAKEAAASGGYIPIYKGAETAIKDHLFREIADILSKSTYHQNFLDQDLGPSLGRVINDVSVSVAAGQMTPEAAAAAIQDAADQQ